MDDYFAGAVQPAPVAPTPVAPAYPPAPAYPAYPGVAPQGWGQPYPVTPPSSTARSVLIGLLAAFAALVVLGVLAAIAIPVFLNQRDLARRTTVSVPAQVAGMPRSTDAAGLAAEARMQGLPGPGDHVAGAYGTGSTRVILGVARYRMSADDQAAYLDNAEKEATTEAVHLHSVAAGRLGGGLRCGASTVAAMTMCVFADGGSYGVVVVTGQVPDPIGTARAAREAFVHRS